MNGMNFGKENNEVQLLFRLISKWNHTLEFNMYHEEMAQEMVFSNGKDSQK
jgi:hypothetical protein